MRTQVGIVGAGPAGLLLSHLLALRGVESVVVENRSREYCEARQRAGVLESGSVRVLREAGLAARLDRQGLEHGGIYLQFAGRAQHIDFRELTGRTVTVYAQTEVVKDLIAARLAAGAAIEFGISDAEVDAVTSDRPVLRYTSADGVRREVTCDAIAGCDGFHGICRDAIPAGAADGVGDRLPVRLAGHPRRRAAVHRRAHLRPSSDRGFALHSLRSPQLSRLYLQVPPEEDIAAWPDDRIWAELQRRFELPGWELTEGPVLDKNITPMRSFVSSPMRHGRLFLAGDAAHIVPPTGAKGLNLALADVTVLAAALTSLVRDGSGKLADAYSDACLDRVWRATHFSWWMTTMLHATPGAGSMEAQLQLSQLRYVTSSTAAATSLAENYVGYRPAVPSG